MPIFVLPPHLMVEKTSRFSTINLNNNCPDWILSFTNNSPPPPLFTVCVNINCAYTDAIVRSALSRRPWCRVVDDIDSKVESSNTQILQFGDFENIEWEPVVAGKHIASSYLVRKGLSRKAQLALQIKRYCSKHPTSRLKESCPFTLILETWNAFEEMKLDFGGGTFASFDTSTVLHAPLRQRLEWCLEDMKEEVERPDRSGFLWILKPSVTNKGASVIVAKDWSGILDGLEDTPDIREWVLQQYIQSPLLLGGHKFHLRVYVLCVGALKVYVYEGILVLLAAHKYDVDDLDDIYKHLTNTARSAEDINFDEKKFVKLLSEDLPELKNHPLVQDPVSAVASIRQCIRSITGELFAAFENEYTIFSPMANCFELYGLDFMVDENLGVHLLEVNPGPDFKQTGNALQAVIVNLWEETCALVIDDADGIGVRGENGNKLNEMSSKNQTCHQRKESLLTKVYDKEWSVASIQGGMKMI